MDQKPIDRFNFRELSNIPIKLLAESFNLVYNAPNTTAPPLLDTLEPRHSGRIVKAPYKFVFLREVISDEHDLDPSNYNKAISDKDFENWQNTMKVEMESMYSNHFWKLVEPSANVKIIGCKWVYIKKKRTLWFDRDL